MPYCMELQLSALSGIFAIRDFISHGYDRYLKIAIVMQY
jgi:hypothetical protein